MKTESFIAEENINRFENACEDYENKKNQLALHYKVVDEKVLKEHKATCKRFLEWLNKMNYNWTEESKDGFAFKVTDLKQVIKLYEDAEI